MAKGASLTLVFGAKAAAFGREREDRSLAVISDTMLLDGLPASKETFRSSSRRLKQRVEITMMNELCSRRYI